MEREKERKVRGGKGWRGDERRGEGDGNLKKGEGRREGEGGRGRRGVLETPPGAENFSKCVFRRFPLLVGRFSIRFWTPLPPNFHLVKFQLDWSLG